MQGMEVSKDYLPALGLKIVAGRAFEEADFKQGTQAILLGYEFWQRAFAGDTQIVGNTVRISRWTCRPSDRCDAARRSIPSFAGSGEEPNYNVNATVDFWVPVRART